MSERLRPIWWPTNPYATRSFSYDAWQRASDAIYKALCHHMPNELQEHEVIAMLQSLEDEEGGGV